MSRSDCDSGSVPELELILQFYLLCADFLIHILQVRSRLPQPQEPRWTPQRDRTFFEGGHDIARSPRHR